MNPTTEAGWLHKLDMAKNEAWLQGYAQGQSRSAELIKKLEKRVSDLGWETDYLRQQEPEWR